MKPYRIGKWRRWQPWFSGYGMKLDDQLITSSNPGFGYLIHYSNIFFVVKIVLFKNNQINPEIVRGQQRMDFKLPAKPSYALCNFHWNRLKHKMLVHLQRVNMYSIQRIHTCLLRTKVKYKTISSPKLVAQETYADIT